jgi:uncharacterized repeat protein (TIGR01451 family)
LAGGALPPGLTLAASGVISGTVHPFARGNFAFTVEVKDGSTPPQSAVRALSLTVVAIADISLGLSGSPNPVDVNSPLTYAMTVANAGPSSATNLAVTFTMPPSGTFMQGSAGCGITPLRGQVRCAISSLAAGTATQLTIVVRPTEEGIFESTASVAAIEPDPTGNNTATESTTVRAPIVFQRRQ